MTKTNLKKFAKEAEKLGFSIRIFDDYIEMSYYTEHGGEECLEPQTDENLYEYLDSYCADYDASYETYLWLDETGHGKNGAPYDMRDILSDKEEWEAKVQELSEIAAKYE